MSPEEFKIQQLTKQIGQMAQDHAAAVTELHLQYTIQIQGLQAKIEELTTPTEAEPDAKGGPSND